MLTLKMLHRSLFLISAILSVQCNIYQLPNNVRPLRYVLTLEANLTYNGWWASSKFWGGVTIQLQTLDNTKNITLHASQLDINQASIKIIGHGVEVGVVSTTYNRQHHTFTINLNEDLVSHQIYNLTIGEFTGQFEPNSRGLYKAHYALDGNPRTVAVTHFEPTLARYAFPCFDEPHMKATFVINLIRSKEYNSISNEDLQYTEDLGNDRYKDVFKETPPMPTYSVAFAISDFKSTPRKEKQRIFAQPEAFKENEVEYPLELSIKTLRILEEYTGINFTLSKMDSFAIPTGYFRHFAMENYGLITYGEEYIRCSEKTDINTLTRIVTYIAHEFAHQWFGNLVTAASWDYIWLSESFSAYFQYYTASKVQPSWRLMDQFVIEMVQESFHDEQLQGAHPLNFRISRYGEFPPFHIMYQKGSSIVRMMSHFLTEEVFRKALHNYLLDRQFKSVVPEDLYRLVQKTVDKEGVNHLLGNMTFGEILETWDSFKGFPIVTVTRNYSTGDVEFTQSTTLAETDKIWKIPINYVASEKGVDFTKTTADFWLVNKSMISKNLPTEGWVVVNKQHAGYYRVNYDVKNWERLIDLLKSDKFESIHYLNRAQLIYDSFYMASIDKLPFDIPYRLAEYLIRERDYIPFAAFYNSLSQYSSMYRGRENAAEIKYFQNHSLNNSVVNVGSSGYSKEYLIFQEYIRNILGNVRHFLGPEEKASDSYLDRIHRNAIERYFPYYFV